MSGTPTVSIIVPVYNVEKYILSCLQSIADQSFGDYEVILVNDGSQDGSVSICQTFIKKDDRFRLVSQENGGVSSARNFGLTQAKGTWLLFVDPDDMIVENLLIRCLERVAETNSDLVAFRYAAMDESGIIADLKLDAKPSYRQMTGERAVAELCLGSIEDYVWSFVARRSLYESSSIRFPQGRRMEDAATTYRILSAANRVVLMDEKLYLYRSRPDSIVSTVDKRYIDDFLFAIDDSRNGIIQLYSELDGLAQYRSLRQLLACLSLARDLKDAGDGSAISQAQRDIASRIRSLSFNSIVEYCSINTLIKYIFIKLHLTNILLFIGKQRKTINKK